MREAARSVVTLRHTYNLVDLPIRVAGKSGTAEFGVRDSKGRLPFHSWFVGFVPKNAKNGRLRRRNDSNLVVLAFAYDSRTEGNAGTEIVKYFLQLHYGIKKDYRNLDLLDAATSTATERSTMSDRCERPSPSRSSRLDRRARSARSGARSTCSSRSTPRCWRASGSRWPTATASRPATPVLEADRPSCAG